MNKVPNSTDATLQPIGAPQVQERRLKSLTNFPEDFQPLVVVTGDRREVPPRSKGDVLAYSSSNTDVMYLNRLRIVPTGNAPENGLVVSDKQFVIDPEEILASRFGSTNILVIGSPAVNLLARRINEESLFRFAISDETQRELEEQNRFMTEFVQDDDDLFIYHQCLEGILDVDIILARLVELAPNIEILREKAHRIVPEFRKSMICRDLQSNPRPIRYLMHKLDRPGIYDSYSRSIRGESIGAYKDYGLISVLPSPFDHKGNYHIVYVAGVHGPGTAVGLKMLSDRHAFAHHPYGGVYDVNINRFASYFEKIQKSTGQWETRGYKETDSVPTSANNRTFQTFLSSPSKRDDIEQKAFNEEVKRALQQICQIKGIRLKFEQPYTIALGGGDDFWRDILNYERTCDFVLHDVTNFARGVLVEIGFSYGSRKPHFLIWNSKKTPLKLSDVSIPKLLPVHQIEMINGADATEISHVLREKIVNRMLDRDRPFDFEDCKPLPKSSTNKGAFVHTSEPRLRECLDKELRSRRILPIAEEESRQELRICRINQVLAASDFALIQLDENDSDGFIMLGLAKALGVKTLPLRLDRYTGIDFPWSREIVKFGLEGLEQQLSVPLAKFLNY